MAAKRTVFQRENDLRDIADWYLRGWTQQQIADTLNADPERDYILSRVSITNDLKEIKSRWLTSSLRDFDEARAQELAKIDRLEIEYLDAWQRSCADAETETKRQRQAGEGNEVKEMTKVVKGQAGDPRFLQGVQWCIERRCKILGIDAPSKTDLTSDGKAVTFNVVYKDA